MICLLILSAIWAINSQCILDCNNVISHDCRDKCINGKIVRPTSDPTTIIRVIYGVYPHSITCIRTGCYSKCNQWETCRCDVAFVDNCQAVIVPTASSKKPNVWIKPTKSGSGIEFVDGFLIFVFLIICNIL